LPWRSRSSRPAAYRRPRKSSLVSRKNRSPAVAIVPNVANDIVPATRTIAAENLFLLPDGRLSFDDFVAADADRDGVLAYAELLAAKEKRYTEYVSAASDALQGEEAERTRLPPLSDGRGGRCKDVRAGLERVGLGVRTCEVVEKPATEAASRRLDLRALSASSCANTAPGVAARADESPSPASSAVPDAHASNEPRAKTSGMFWPRHGRRGRRRRDQIAHRRTCDPR